MSNLLRFAHQDEIANWDQLLAGNPAAGEVFQSRSFAEIKRQQGWRPQFLVYELRENPKSLSRIYILILSRFFPTFGQILYSPRGPSIRDPKLLKTLAKINREFIPRLFPRAILLKLEPPILRENLKILPPDFAKTADIQLSLASTSIINLAQSENDLWQSFRQRARRAIRGAKKENLRVISEAFSWEAADKMWRLCSLTARRAHVATRSKTYRLNFWREFCSRDQGRFFFCYAPTNLMGQRSSDDSRNSDTSKSLELSHSSSNSISQNSKNSPLKNKLSIIANDSGQSNHNNSRETPKPSKQSSAATSPDDFANQTPVAGAFICWSGQNALYKDGGSTRDSKTHFSHFLQWEIMKFLREKNIKFYDLDGTPPRAQLENPSHRLSSLATFKLSFGADVTDFAGTFDQIFREGPAARWRKFDHFARKLAYHTPKRDIY